MSNIIKEPIFINKTSTNVYKKISDDYVKEIQEIKTLKDQYEVLKKLEILKNNYDKMVLLLIIVDITKN